MLTKSLTLTNLDYGFWLDGFTITGGVFIEDSSGEFIIQNVTEPTQMFRT